MGKTTGEVFKYTIRDLESQDVITMTYHRAFSRERLAYWREIWDSEKKTCIADDFLDEARISWGEKIILGVEFKSDRVESISSDPTSPAYAEDWKVRLRERFPQALETLCLKVFDGMDLGVNSEATQEEPPEKK